MYIETTLLDGNITCNSSPTFANIPIFVVCDSLAQSISNSVIEADGDSIVYSLTTLWLLQAPLLVMQQDFRLPIH